VWSWSPLCYRTPPLCGESSVITVRRCFAAHISRRRNRARLCKLLLGPAHIALELRQGRQRLRHGGLRLLQRAVRLLHNGLGLDGKLERSIAYLASLGVLVKRQAVVRPPRTHPLGLGLVETGLGLVEAGLGIGEAGLGVGKTALASS
jgi:hypothetical protein